MSILVKTISVFILTVILMITNAQAIEMPSTDDGTDKNGDVIVAPTLALRCGISSQNPSITSDCLDRLAYDYKSGQIVSGDFLSYDDERKAIIGEYAGAYFQKSLEQLVEASGYEDKINKEVCIDSTELSCMSASNDTRAEMEYNNKLATSNTMIMLEALKLRSLKLNMDSVDIMLGTIVPTKDVDLNNKSLAGAP